MARPLPVIANTWLVSQRLSQPSELHDMRNVFCIQDLAGAATTAAMAESFADVYVANLLPVMSSGVVFGATDMIKLDGVSSVNTIATDSVGQTGGHATGNQAPELLAFGITWQSGVRGKSKRGRSYLPGLSTDQLLDLRARALTTTAFTALQTAASGFVAGGPADPTTPWILTVLSRKLGTAQAIVTGRANPNAVVQRRRYERVAHR
jgi:hypothetical protein